MKTKRYPHVTGLYGDSGENPGALAVHAVLDPSPNYPESGRIIVGSPATTPTLPGYIPNLGGFNGGPAAIEQLAATLLEAARDARAAMGEQPDDRPSIAALQRLLSSDSTDGNLIALADAASVLLEIAAAALTLRGPCDHPEGRCPHGSHFRGCSRFMGERRLEAALAKVRP